MAVMHDEAMKYLILLVSLLIFAESSSAEIYKWTGEKEHIHYSNIKPENEDVIEIEFKISTYESVSYNTSKVDLGKNVVTIKTPTGGTALVHNLAVPNVKVVIMDGDIGLDQTIASGFTNASGFFEIIFFWNTLLQLESLPDVYTLAMQSSQFIQDRIIAGC